MNCPDYHPANGPDFWRRPYSTTQAARVLQVSPGTVRNLIECGKLPARRFRRNWQIPRPALQALLEQNLCPNCTRRATCRKSS